MLTIFGDAKRYCDGVSRRNFLKIGALGFGGLSLPQLLRAEQSGGTGKSHKAVIMVYMPGGPPHQDMYDIKTEAPSDIRGEFSPIKTNVKGIEISEMLPRIAGMMDKFIPIRSIVGADGGHDDFQCMTGRSLRNQPPGGWPSFGACVNKVLGPVNKSIPPYIGLEPRMQHRPYNSATSGFLGVANESFKPSGQGKDDMVLKGVSLDRLRDRKSLLTAFDGLRKEIDNTGAMEGVDAFNEQAYGILTSARLAKALDISTEDPKTIEMYGKGDARVRGDAAGRINEQFLMARRLVEAGARVVTLAFSFWDYHGQNYKNARQDMPMFDQAITGLVSDLHSRGLDKDVSVIAWGEFGRTPTLNKDAGRDHWPNVSCGLLACGGMRTGQVIGSTDRQGGEAKDRPVKFGEVFATLYHNLGIDPLKATVNDLSGRPRYLVDDHKPLHEVI